MEKFIVSVMPSFYCSRKCPYCYLGRQTDDPTVLSLEVLRERLTELSKENELLIDLFGGELDELPYSYLKELISLCKEFSRDIFISSGCTNGNCFSIARDEKIKLAISLNDERPFNKETEDFILKYKDCYRNISISQVVLPSLIRKSPSEVLDYLQKFNLPVTFFRYIRAGAATKRYRIGDESFERFIIGIYNYYEQHNNNPYEENPYTFPILNPRYETMSDPSMSTNIFIMPSGKYASVAYKEGLEYFKTYEQLMDWKKSCIEENKEYFRNCSKCRYYKRCLAEHLDFSLKSKNCNGLPNLCSYLESLK